MYPSAPGNFPQPPQMNVSIAGQPINYGGAPVPGLGVGINAATANGTNFVMPATPVELTISAK